MNPIYTKAAAILLCVICAFAVPTTLYAHAILLESSPKPESKVKGPSLSVWLRFNVRVDGGRSRTVLVSDDGNTKRLTFDPQPKPNVLSAKATGLSAGKYKLQWQVLAADGHITSGEFAFYVE
ncbi:MAG TPA: copper resistance CopC family protein [Candidatus Acidoferrales bacterium]|nr:copper resistance CopC family protein [Candidatus Acidoferrales bacterium]